MNLKIGIKGFKSIVDAEFEPGQVNVLIGANGTGKSALLEAIGMLSAALSGKVENETLSCRGVRLGTPQLYKSAFKELNMPDISLSIRWPASQEEIWDYSVKLATEVQPSDSSWYYQEESLKLNNQLLCDRDKATEEVSRWSENAPSQTIPFKTGNATSSIIGLPMLKALIGHHTGLCNLILRSQAEQLPSAKRFLETLTSYAIYTPTTLALRDLITDVKPFHISFPVGLSGGRLAEALQDMRRVEKEPFGEEEEEKFGTMDLDEVLDLLDWVDTVSTGQANSQILSPQVSRLQKSILFQDRFMSKSNNVLTAYDANEGSLHVLFLLTLAMHPLAPRMFAVENFDQALNPRLARTTADLFSEAILANPRSPLVFLTTHHPLVLDGLDFHDERIRLFAVDRNRQGHTTIKRVMISEELLEEGKKGFTLSDLWVMGYLGGVPNL